MPNNILQKFLDAGLFNFGDDDQRLKDFQAAATDMAKEFVKSPEKVIPAVLVAIDPAVPDGDPVLDQAEAAIKGHWSSFRNKFSERPKAFLRPVLWEALSQAAADNTEIASAIWLSGASVLPYLAAPKEREIVEEFLLNQGGKMETMAEQTWSLSLSGAEFTAPALTLRFPKIQGINVDQGALEQGLSAASGPHDRSNNRYPGANQHWPNAANNWSWEFAPRAAAAISAQVNKALEPLANQASALGEQVEPQLKKYGKEISAAIGVWVNASASGLARRSALLWWKESLYSPTLHKSYRDLSPAEIAVSMALDLHRLAPAPSPQSVEFFLRETFYAASPKQPKASISEFMMQAGRSKVLGELLTSDGPPATPRRISLLNGIQFTRRTKLDDGSLTAWLGVKADLRQPLAELAVWIFRDAQAISLTQGPKNP
jgi:hypothetical protein